MTKEETQALQTMLEEVIQASEDRINLRLTSQLQPIHDKLDELKEEAAI